MVAAKFHDDQYGSNEYFAKVGGISSNIYQTATEIVQKNCAPIKFIDSVEKGKDFYSEGKRNMFRKDLFPEQPLGRSRTVPGFLDSH